MSDLLNVVILGTGCAGNTAAIYAARANLSPIVFEGHEPGGQLSITTEVENFPGFPEGVQGPALVENMKQQAIRFGAEYRSGRLVKADLSNHPFTLEFDTGDVLKTRTLIVATGASARWLNLPNEQKLIGHGVSSCATCDGFFYRDKQIMVIGGGDSAMEEANFLTRFGREVALVHRSETFRASRIMLARAQANAKIKFITNTVVEDVYDVAKGEVTGVKLQEFENGRSVRPRCRWIFCRDRAYSEYSSHSLVSSISIVTDIFFRTAGRGPIFPGCFMRATCRIAFTGRRLRPPERAAWRRLRPNGIWKPKGTDWTDNSSAILKQGAVIAAGNGTARSRPKRRRSEAYTL